MKNKYKILLNYIKDLSVEIPGPTALIESRDNISKYKMKIDISSNVLKNKMIEVITKLTYAHPSDIKNKAYLEIHYASVINILDEKIDKKILEKIILCDLQLEIYPGLEKIILDILKISGFPNIKFDKKIDFEHLYNKRLN